MPASGCEATINNAHRAGAAMPSPRASLAINQWNQLINRLFLRARLVTDHVMNYELNHQSLSWPRFSLINYMLIINAMDPFASQGPCMLSKTITHWYALSVQLLERGPKTIVHCDAMRTDPADRLCTGVDSQAIRATSPLACWSRTIFLCGAAQSDLATNTKPMFSSAWHVLFVAFGDSFDVRFFISLHSATAAHNLLLLMQLFRRLVESPVLGTACLEQPAAYSLKIHLPERHMDICIIRLDCACEG